jgi:hypothetical protein
MAELQQIKLKVSCISVAVDEPVTTTKACLMTHIWLLLGTKSNTLMYLYNQLH